ncbi:MAG: RIP metalloprotease RseP [Flavobacteriaceae bacterium]|nr:MAG: RIP metalloprotease RseP [Flavobacteriaceae bacterium]
MEILIKASQFILSLSLLIVLHELGHFIPAKLFKTKVEKFYLFFDYKFSLVKKKIGETVYGIGWIPLGGYVKIAGMIDESMDTEQMKGEPQPWEFRSKPAWQRLIIMLGGVFVNFVLGILIYIMLMYAYGEKYVVNDSLKAGIWVEGTLGQKLGLQNGDKIVSVDGNKIINFNRVNLEFINGNTFKIERGGEIIEKEIPVDFIDELLKRGKNGGLFVSWRIPFVIGKDFDENSPNKNGELKFKDIVVSVNEVATPYYDLVKDELAKYKNDSVFIKVKRGDDIVNIGLKLDSLGRIGMIPFQPKVSNLDRMGYLTLKTKTYTFGQAIPRGVEEAYKTLTDYMKQLKKVLNPETGAYKGLGGFISIGDIFPAKWNAEDFWRLTALLSIMLGFMNLLPIPALDGGHVVFTLWEMITGKKPGDKFLEYAQIVGFILLIALLLFANGNDIFRLLK